MNSTQPTMKRNFVMSMLALSMAGMSLSTQAKSNSEEIQQLHQEVQELRELLSQYAGQQKIQAQHLQAVQATSAATALPVQAPMSATQKGLGMTVGKAEVSFYGNVRADASYQAEGGSAARLYNQISTVPLKGYKESSDQFKSTLSATRLGADFKTSTQGGDVGGKIEVDFLGGPGLDTLRIRHAYVNYNDWLIGQTWSNFAVPDYMPESIDALGYVGGAVKRTPQVRHTTKFNPATNLVVALEDPKDGSSNMRLPALTARVNHKISDTAAMSLRGMVNDKRTDADNETAWGVGAGLKYEMMPGTTFKADYYHVKGDSSFVSWANSGFVVNTNKDIVATNEFDSITVGLTQQFNPQWRGTLGYGYMKADNNQDYINALIASTPANEDSYATKANKNLWQAWGNVFYSPTKPLSFGLEYVYGEREAFKAAPNGSTTGEDNRVSAVAIYNF